MSNTTSRNTPAFYAQAAISFGLSLLALLVALVYMPVEAWMRAFFAIDALWMVSSAFTLAKCVRDAQEDEAVVNRLDAARLERLLAEYDPFRPPALPDPAPAAKGASSPPMAAPSMPGPSMPAPSMPAPPHGAPGYATR